MTNEQQVVPGIFVTSGQATVDPSLSDVLFDLAVKLEELTNQPVDVQHVLAAIVLAARSGEIESDATITSTDQSLIEVLTPHVQFVFENYGGVVGGED